MCTHNIGLCGEITKKIFSLSFFLLKMACLELCRRSVQLGPAKFRVSLLSLRSSESSLGAFWIDKAAKCLHADNEDSDQPAHPRRLIRVFVVRVQVSSYAFFFVWRTSQPVRFLNLCYYNVCGSLSTCL